MKFDAIISANDPDFVTKLRQVIGLKEGETAQFVFPQFTRTDGVVPVLLTKDVLDVLGTAKPETLRALGLQVWDEPDVLGQVLWLFPGEWYHSIPAGYLVETINGEIRPFEPKKDDADIRFGCLAYGIRAALEGNPFT
jgi:hypothetical protein